MRTCDVPGCERKHYAKGLCRIHYWRVKRHGSTESKHRTRCEVEGCPSPHHGQGYCWPHYLRWKRNGSATTAGGHGRNWTEAEDARLRALMDQTPPGQRIAAGDCVDLAMMLGRTVSAVHVRAYKLRRKAAEAAQAPVSG